MKMHQALPVATLVAAFALATGVPAFAENTHQHAAGEPARLVLHHGKKWATDEPLRRNMSEIRAALAAKAAAIHQGTLTPEDYQTLGILVEAHIASIVAECKLEPAADKNLHLVVAELSAGADAMRGKSTATPAAGAAQAVGAVNRYGRYFQHPGWKPLD
ncbi:MAG TPA: hypothetical protein PK201_03245 [Accumulibacter sp.]|nr:hypothetical protein [Accumulibacter sp.]